MFYRILPFLLTYIARRVSKTQKAKRVAGGRSGSSTRRRASRRGR
ncbi:hypothetical protein ACVLV4_002536 [Rathayibacter agropyri]